MLLGILLKVAATFAFASMSAIIKAVSPHFPVGEIVLFRSLFAMATLVVWLARRGEFPHALRTRRKLGHVGRSIAGSGGMFFGFIALSLLPLADATAFTFVSPLLIVPMAAVGLGETVRAYRWAAVGIGFLGVLVMLSDDLGQAAGATPGNGYSAGAAIALCGAFCTAVAMIQTRRLSRSEATGAIVFYFTSVTTVISAVLLTLAAAWPTGAVGADFFAGQRFVAPSGLEFGLLISIGLLGGSGQILMTHGYRFADASVIAAFDYVSMIWAATLGYAFFAETPSAAALSGAAVVAAASLYVIWRERFSRGALKNDDPIVSAASSEPR
jgi:drug/metabolite transporter (DMT)-like permease